MPALRPDGLTAYLRTYGDSQPPTGTVIRTKQRPHGKRKSDLRGRP